MKSVNSIVSIGGYFTSISDTIANYIAIWNGSKWGRLGSGLDDAPYSIEVGKTGLFVSGSFRKAGNINSSAIAKWRLEKDTTNNGYIKSIDKPQIDRNQKLKENFPQPFKEETKFYVNLEEPKEVTISVLNCLLYTSDAADERSSVDLGGRRIIKKKKHTQIAGSENKHKKIKKKRRTTR